MPVSRLPIRAPHRQSATCLRRRSVSGATPALGKIGRIATPRRLEHCSASRMVFLISGRQRDGGLLWPPVSDNCLCLPETTPAHSSSAGLSNLTGLNAIAVYFRGLPQLVWRGYKNSSRFFANGRFSLQLFREVRLKKQQVVTAGRRSMIRVLASRTQATPVEAHRSKREPSLSKIQATAER